MSNRTVPAAAEGMLKRDYGDLESAISDARMFADLVLYVGERALMNDGAAMDDNRAHVPVMKWERDLVMFVAEQAKKAAGIAIDELYAMVEASR